MLNEDVYEKVEQGVNKISPLQREELHDLFRPYKRTVIWIVLISIIQSALQATILLTMKPMLDDSIKSSNIDSIYVYGSIVMLMIILHGTCAITVSRMSAKVTANIAEKSRREMFKRVVITDELDPSSDTSGMMIRLMNDIDNVQRMVTDLLRTFLYTAFLTIGLITVSFIVDFRVGAAFFIATVTVYIVIILAARSEYKYRKEIITKLEAVIRIFRSYLKGERNRRYLGCTESDQERFRTISSDYSKSCDDTRIRAYSRSSFARLLFTGMLCVLVLLYVLFVDNTKIDFSSIVLFVQMALLLETSLTMYPIMIESIPIASASVDKINEAIRYGVHERDKVPERCDSEYIIRSNSDSYPSIRRGQETTIITMSDAGAWDFVQMVMATRNAPKGMLYLDDEDISEIDRRYITGRIAYAGPKAMTIDKTILENIDLWRGIDESRITEVCRALEIEKPLDFELQRGGTNISSGEAFKISMARALVSDADMYIFDNTFIMLDHDVKRRIVRYIRSSKAGKTVVFITSNASISNGSDNIVMVSCGKVICNDTGTNVRSSNSLFDELRKAKGCAVERE